MPAAPPSETDFAGLLRALVSADKDLEAIAELEAIREERRKRGL